MRWHLHSSWHIRPCWTQASASAFINRGLMINHLDSKNRRLLQVGKLETDHLVGMHLQNSYQGVRGKAANLPPKHNQTEPDRIRGRQEYSGQRLHGPRLSELGRGEQPGLGAPPLGLWKGLRQNRMEFSFLRHGPHRIQQHLDKMGPHLVPGGVLSNQGQRCGRTNLSARHIS